MSSFLRREQFSLRSSPFEDLLRREGRPLKSTGRRHQQLAAPAFVGVEATGNSQWFLELVEDLGHEIWVGCNTFL